MRKTLKTTTAVLACLNLAVPYPAIAQTGNTAGAEGTPESSACTTDPGSQECRNAVEQGLAEPEGQTEDSAGEEQPEDGAAQGQDQGTEQSAAPEPEAGEGTDPIAGGGEDGAEVTEPAQGQWQDVPETSEPADGGAAEEPMTPETPQADGAAGAAAGADGSGTEPQAGSAAPAEEPPASGTPQAGGEGGSTDEESPEVQTGTPAEESLVEQAPATNGAGEEPMTEEAPAAGGDDQAEVQTPDAEEASEPEAAPPADTGGEQSRAAQPVGEDAADAEAPGTAAAPESDAADGDAAAAPISEPASGAAEAPQPRSGAANANREVQPSGEIEATVESGTEESDTTAETGTSTDGAGNQQILQQDEEPAAGDQASGSQQNAGAGQDAGTLAATAAGDGEVEAQDVTTETVSEESARSSAEDFASEIDQSPEASSEERDDDGLSNLEKALLLGAGALAVGTIMQGGREVVAASDDRVVVSGSDGNYELIKDDNALLRRPGSEVQTETYDDGSTRTIVNRDDGSQIITIRDPQLRVVRRVRVTPDGQQVVLIDDTETVQPVDTSTLQAPVAETRTYSQSMDQEALRQALAANREFERRYSLNQVRSIEQVREQVPAIDLENITFASGSAAISPEQADELTQLGQHIASRIAENPREIFLVEGHTDAVGDAAYNLALSDRRAESVALALTEYFGVAPENLVVQGYGEQFLKVQTEAAEQTNRRASIRRITPLLQVAVAQ